MGDESTGPAEQARSGRGAPGTGGTPPPPGSPDQVELVPAAGVTSPRRRGRGPLLIVLAALVSVVLGAALLAAPDAGVDDGHTDDDERDARTELEAVHAAIGEAPTFRFRFEGLDTTGADRGPDGRETPGWFSGEGEWTANRWRLVNHDASGVSETILDGDTVHARWPDQGQDLASAPWESWGLWPEQVSHDEVLDEMSSMMEEAEVEEGQLDPGFVDWLSVALAAEMYLGDHGDRVDWVDLEVEATPFPDDPTAFLQLIRRDGRATIVGKNDDTLTIGAILRAPSDVVGAFGHPIPDGRMELDVGADHLPVALRLDIAGGDQSFAIKVQFGDWSSPIDIEVPPDGQTGGG